MAIAKFINGMDIQRLYNEQNPDHPIGYAKACTVKKMCRKKYEEEYGKVTLHDDDLIPLSWYETYFGEDAFDPRKKRKKKDTPSSGKQVSV